MVAKKTQRIISILVILAIAIFISQIIIPLIIVKKWNVFLFWSIYIIIAGYTISYNKVARFQIFKPYKYLSILYALISFSIIFISIIFGFHTDVLAHYDDKQSNGDFLYWFNPKNIMEFPEINDNLVYNAKSLIDEKDEKKDTIYNIFLIDNSFSSNEKQQNIDTLLEKTKSKIFGMNDELKLNNTIQAISLLLINKINERKDFNYFTLRTIAGINNLPNSFSETEYNNNDGRSHYLKKTICNVLELDKETTSKIDDFIFNENNYANNFTGIKIDKYPIRVFVISDFLNTNDTENDNFDESFEDYKNFCIKPKFLSVNFIKVKGSDEKAKDISNYFFKEFENYNFSKKLTSINTIETSIVTLERDLTDICVKSHEDYIDFFYDNSNYRKNEDVFTIIDNNIDNLKIKLYTKSSKLVTNCLIRNLENNTEEYFDINDENYKEIKSKGKFKIIIENYRDFKDKEFFLKCDIDEKDNIEYKILPNPVLSKSNTFGLIIIYSILIGSLSLMFFYLYYSKKFIKKINEYYNYHIIIFMLFSILSLVPIVYYIFSCYSFILIKSIVFIVLIVLTYPLYKRCLIKINKDFDEKIKEDKEYEKTN